MQAVFWNRNPDVSQIRSGLVSVVPTPSRPLGHVGDVDLWYGNALQVHSKSRSIYVSSRGEIRIQTVSIASDKYVILVSVEVEYFWFFSIVTGNWFSIFLSL
jgi:hypothetical protein